MKITKIDQIAFRSIVSALFMTIFVLVFSLIDITLFGKSKRMILLTMALWLCLMVSFNFVFYRKIVEGTPVFTWDKRKVYLMLVMFGLAFLLFLFSPLKW